MSPRAKDIKQVRPEKRYKQAVTIRPNFPWWLWRSSQCEKVTSKNFFRPSLRKNSKVLKGNYHSLNVPKHSRKAKTEEHDEKEDCPERRNRHLDDGLCEHDEGQACSLHTLKKYRSNLSSSDPILNHFCDTQTGQIIMELTGYKNEGSTDLTE